MLLYINFNFIKKGENKGMKKSIKLLLVALLFCFALAPAISAEAATQKPVKPSGLGLYSQDKGKVSLSWKYDSNLSYYSTAYPGYYGYEIVITTLKNKKIATLDSSDNYGSFYTQGSSKIMAVVSNSKFKSQGYKFKVRSYVYDDNAQKVYSDYSSEKVIVPRASIKSGKLVKNRVKITWGKVSGAKSYNIYMSSNSGKSYKKIGSTKKTNYTIKKSLKKYKTYYVYVSANSVKYKGKKNSSTKPTDKTANAYSFYITTRYR